MKSPRRRGFTLVELLTVMAIIVLLAGLTIQTVGYVQKKAARSRAEAEIAAFGAALESYKADNGIYPSGNATNTLNARTNNSPANYKTASRVLYQELSGDRDLDVNRRKDTDATQYLEFKPNMLEPTSGSGTVTAILDPFGISYGYSTTYANAALTSNSTTAPTVGYNPTYDLWSTGGYSSKPSGDTDDQFRKRWITNW
jgi:prepilin-type N-terminal cleavage/methylation domain-containing protein